MVWKRLLILKSASIIDLAWVLPTVVSILLVEIFRAIGISIPAPFFIIIICVAIAGTIGGKRSGLIAGILATLFLVRAYFIQFGPATLSGGLPQTIVGSIFFISIGTLLGALKDQRNLTIKKLHDIERKLRNSLANETKDKEIQAAMVSASEARLDTAISDHNPWQKVLALARC
jgi:hypothetical protein